MLCNLYFKLKSDCYSSDVQVSDSGGVNNKTMDILRREFVHLHIYSESSDTTLIEEKNIYTEWSLLSNIGGNMGMFLGLSIVGFFKVIFKFLSSLVALKVLICTMLHWKEYLMESFKSRLMNTNGCRNAF